MTTMIGRYLKITTAFYGLILLVSGCAHPIPVPTGEYGMLVLPVQAISPNKTPFAYRYILKMDGLEGKELYITPNVSRPFVVYEGIKPGRYEFTEISAIGRRNTQVVAGKRFLPPKPMHIQFEIYANEITVLDHAFNIRSNVTRRPYGTQDPDTWNFVALNEQGANKVQQALRNHGYLSQWEIGQHTDKSK